MLTLDQIRQITVQNDSKIVLLIMDGLGGLPNTITGKTELETANKPNLDFLARNGICGVTDPISMGITPGSGPGHLAIFGYDPLKYIIGRGVLEALGIEFELYNSDVAARGNFCTIDSEEIITDRRAGRISTEQCAKLCEILSKIKLKDVNLYVVPVKEHRFLLVFRSNNKLSDKVTDTDPQQTGLKPLTCRETIRQESAVKTANIVNSFVIKAKQLLSSYYPANMILLRGFSTKPELPTMQNIYKLKPAAIASYPMYRGLAKLLGMQLLEKPDSILDSVKIIKKYFDYFDFFFIHIKGTDSAGEDGNFDRKVHIIEEVDNIISDIIQLKPDVLIVTGDHSTPAMLKSHSWHPVPFVLYSKWCRKGNINSFTESECVKGCLGRFSAINIMPLALAHALKLSKFGA